MKQEIEYYCPTAKEMNQMLESLEKTEFIGGISDNSEKITIPLDWFYELREKAEKYDEIMEKRKKASEKSKTSLMKNMTAEERKARSLKAIQARWGKK